MRGGVLLSRSLIAIPNIFTQERFAGLPDGLDGELIVGKSNDPATWNATSKGLSARDGAPEDVCFWVFDDYTASGGFADRFEKLQAKAVSHPGFRALWERGLVRIVPHEVCRTLEDIARLEQLWVDSGYEGLMLRSLTGPYKHGRSTEREGSLMKVKRFFDSEAVIVGFKERMRNDNVAVTNALGETERSTHKAGMVGLGCLGAFEVEWAQKSGDKVRFSVGTGINQEQSVDYWACREELMGTLVRFKYQSITTDSIPRFPVFQGLRAAIDL
jgi:DNA ligase 1